MSDRKENAQTANDESRSKEPTDQYVVVARRYRPKDFGDLVGQSQASTALKNAIQQNRVGHAYLFTGARGVGKTSTARIFAKCLNCVDGPTIEPCNQCDICEGIASGEDIDVIEIDGASNRGIDEIRQLRSNANIRPSRARYKVYIIDEVHMLTAPAFNALLKTLEEPPGHVKFIFCTTDPEKIPITVLSRCQRYDFVPVKLDAIKARLAEIVANENLLADDEALALLARRAGGSMRDSQSLLEQVLSYCDGRVTTQHVHELLGTADNEIVFEIGKSCLESDSAACLNAVGRAVSAGVDPNQLSEQLVAFFRDLMVVKVGGPEEILNATSTVEIDFINIQKEQAPLERIMASIQILDQSISRMRYSSHPNILVELAVVRICNLQSMNDLAALVEHVRSGNLPVSPVSTTNRGGLKKNEPSINPVKSLGTSHINEAIKPSSPINPGVIQSENAAHQEKTIGLDLNRKNLESIWSQVLDEVADLSAEMAREFQSLKLDSPNRLVVTINDKTKCDYCSQPNRKQRFEEVFEAIVGKRHKIEFETFESAKSTVTKPKPVKSVRQVQKEMEKNPLVESAIKLLDGHITDIKRPSN